MPDLDIRINVTRASPDIGIEVVRETKDIGIKVDRGIGNYPEYEGETEITPGPAAQILQTGGKVLMENIRIKPIPNNYGLITYNGRTITVS